MNKECAIRQAVAEHDFKWPKQLWTGVMFWKGHRITTEEFNEQVNALRGSHELRQDS